MWTHWRTGKYHWSWNGIDTLLLSETEVLAHDTRRMKAHPFKGKIVQSAPGVWSVFRVRTNVDGPVQSEEEDVFYIPVMFNVCRRATAKLALLKIVKETEV